MCNTMLNRIIKTTGDGSSSLFIESIGEQYHSQHGAVQESTHVFIEAGLMQIHKSPIKILEMGLGTGLNCLLTRQSQPKAVQVEYHSIEAYPLTPNEVSMLNYPGHLNLTDDETSFFYKIHQTNWDELTEIAPGFRLQKYKSTLADCRLPENFFDLVYFDAFSPNSQPDLWTTEVFRKIRRSSSAGSILVTYCAKGQVRRNLMEAGFNVERIPGPPGKREMMRARAI